MQRRYKILFNKLKIKKEGAFVPFVILGDPTPEISLKIIDTLIQSGADALELGFPFSDPIADGPVIQNAVLRALSSGIKTDHCFYLLKLIRKKYPNIPIGLLIYANLIFKKGIENFYFICKKIDIDSVLIADVPIEESFVFRNFSNKYNISSIFICPPNANNHLLKLIISYSDAYIYLLSRSGVTGNIKYENISLLKLINKLKKYKSVPILQGFGIYNPKQVYLSIKSGSSGVICGSSIISIIDCFSRNTLEILKNLSKFIAEMKNATKKI